LHFLTGDIIPLLETEEIDSFLYQTVGQDGVHLVSHALDLPLYRRTIEGESVDVEMDYGGKEEGGVSSEGGRHRRAVEGDETEDLYQLLQVVKVSDQTSPGSSFELVVCSTGMFSGQNDIWMRCTLCFHSESAPRYHLGLCRRDLIQLPEDPGRACVGIWILSSRYLSLTDAKQPSGAPALASHP
jgi:hypothetical protein